MRRHRLTAFMLCMLMLTSGCLGLFGNDTEQPEEVDCQTQPTHPDCFVVVITERLYSSTDIHWRLLQTYAGTFTTLLW